MPVFFYKALNDNGTINESSLSAENKEEAGLILQKQGLTPISIKVKEERRKVILATKISLLEKISFTRFMALMLRSGLSMSEGVEALSLETENPALRKFLNELSYGLRTGKRVSEILEKFPQVFDQVFISMIKAGEASGTLSDTFAYLADNLKSEYKLKKQIKGAMVYPTLIFLAMGGMGFIMVFFILPKIGKVFKSMGFAIPIQTQIFLMAGEFLQKNFLLSAIIAAILFLIIYFFSPHQLIKSLVMGILTKLPVTKRIIANIDFTRFCRTLGTLLKSGVSITQAVEVAFSTVNQPHLQKFTAEVKKGLAKGLDLSSILKERRFFPAFITQMLTVGEKSGTLEVVLIEVAEYYGEEAEEDLKNIAQLIEPILILVAGILVGVMVISIISPIYEFIGKIQDLK